ncbi:flippase [Kushneria konosiri]|nr:flippase [Kushneria konosiri]
MNKALINTAWILGEKVMFALAGIFITVYVARYLGPSEFGLISLALAIVALITPLVKLGSESVIFNRLAYNQESGLLLIGASKRVRFINFLVINTIITAGAFFYFDTLHKMLVFTIIIWGSYFITTEIYSVFFNATLSSKFNTIAQNGSLAAAVVLKLIFIHAGATVAFFAAANIIQWFLSWVIKRYFFNKQIKLNLQAARRRSRRHARHLLHAGLPLAISSLSIALYTRTDQVMLGAMLDETHVGWYSAALTLAQGWLMFPVALMTSWMVGINEAARNNNIPFFERRIKNMFLVVFFMALLPALVMGVFRDPIIALVYGDSYTPAGNILAITAISSVFSAYGTAAYRVITVMGGYGFLLKKMLFVSLLNVVLNYILIPRYGMIGAALATLTAEILSALILNAFYQKGRVLRLQVTAFLPRKAMA